MPLKSICKRCNQEMSRMYVRTIKDGPYLKLKDYDPKQEERKFKPIGWYCDGCTRFQLKTKILSHREAYRSGRI
jgi:hypothetical protein